MYKNCYIAKWTIEKLQNTFGEMSNYPSISWWQRSCGDEQPWWEERVIRNLDHPVPRVTWWCLVPRVPINERVPAAPSSHRRCKVWARRRHWQSARCERGQRWGIWAGRIENHWRQIWHLAPVGSSSPSEIPLSWHFILWLVQKGCWKRSLSMSYQISNFL